MKKIKNWLSFLIIAISLTFLLPMASFGTPIIWSNVDGITSLGTLGGSDGVANSINDSGKVVGWSRLSDGSTVHAFIWTEEAGMIDIGVTYSDSIATSINNSNKIVGYGIYDSNVSLERHGFLYTQEDGVIDLGLQPNSINNFNFARDINNQGQVVGDLGGYLWTEQAGYTSLPGMGTTAFAINDSGYVVGSTNTFGGRHAYIWSETDGMIDLGTYSDGWITRANDINNSGCVVGEIQADPYGTSHSHAFLWTEVDGMIDLGTLGGTSSFAIGINDLGQVVGTSYNTSGVRQAFIWTKTDGMIGLDFEVAWDINNLGQIVGESWSVSPQVPEPATMLLFGLGILGLAGVSRKKQT